MNRLKYILASTVNEPSLPAVARRRSSACQRASHVGSSLANGRILVRGHPFLVRGPNWVGEEVLSITAKGTAAAALQWPAQEHRRPEAPLTVAVLAVVASRSTTRS